LAHFSIKLRTICNNTSNKVENSVRRCVPFFGSSLADCCTQDLLFYHVLSCMLTEETYRETVAVRQEMPRKWLPAERIFGQFLVTFLRSFPVSKNPGTG